MRANSDFPFSVSDVTKLAESCGVGPAIFLDLAKQAFGLADADAAMTSAGGRKGTEPESTSSGLGSFCSSDVPMQAMSTPVSERTREDPGSNVDTAPSREGSGPSRGHADTGSATRSRAEQARINGAKSRGPVSAEGKAASSQNAFKHGLSARGVLAPGEDPAAYHAFRDGLLAELRPTGVLQTALVERAAELGWKLKRMPTWEGTLLCSDEQAAVDEDLSGQGALGGLIRRLIGGDADGLLVRLQKYETRIEGSFYRCLKELRALQSAARNGEVANARASASTPAGLGSFCTNDGGKQAGPPPVPDRRREDPDLSRESMRSTVNAGSSRVRSDSALFESAGMTGARAVGGARSALAHAANSAAASVLGSFCGEGVRI